jgi:hypothetical protein
MLCSYNIADSKYILVMSRYILMERCYNGPESCHNRVLIIEILSNFACNH